MRKIIYLSFAVVIVLASISFSSQIKRITLSELQSRSDLIVLGKVTKVVGDGWNDHVSIKIDSYLKGDSKEKDYTFTLVTRGGLKDFDPSLKKGDTGVFFLKYKKQKGEVEKAYWGSIAIFQKSPFNLSDEKGKEESKEKGQ